MQPKVQLSYDPSNTSIDQARRYAQQTLLSLLPLHLFADEAYVIRYYETSIQTHQDNVNYTCEFILETYTDYYNLTERGKC